MSVDLAKLMIEINIVGNPIDAATTKIIPNNIVFRLFLFEFGSRCIPTAGSQFSLVTK